MTVPVERLVLGCAPLGNLFTPVDDDVAAATLEAAWDAGIRTFDTAPLYGHGLSESRLGRALNAWPRAEVTVCTKVGRVLVPGVDHGTIFADVADVKPAFDFTRDGVRRSIEDSLTRLDIDFIDIVHVHDPDDHLDRAVAESYPALAELVAEGVVGAIGLGVNTPSVAQEVLASVDIDHLLLAGRITLLDRSGLDVLEEAEARGVTVFAAGVFNSGVLAHPVAGAHFDYRAAPDDVVARARRIHAVAADFGVSPLAAAIQFPLRFPGVTRVVVGARCAAEVDADVAAASHRIPDGFWSALRSDPTIGTAP